MEQSAKLVRALSRRGLRVAVAESFSGGALMDAITDVPGASKVFVGGVVAYEDAVKVGWLKVRRSTIGRHGAVSESTAVEMALGVRERLGADYGVATTGIAGPTGARPGKPVGTSIVAVAGPDGVWVTRRIHVGKRLRVKRAGVLQALELLGDALSHNQ